MDDFNIFASIHRIYQETKTLTINMFNNIYAFWDCSPMIKYHIYLLITQFC